MIKPDFRVDDCFFEISDEASEAAEEALKKSCEIEISIENATGKVDFSVRDEAAFREMALWGMNELAEAVAETGFALRDRKKNGIALRHDFSPIWQEMFFLEIPLDPKELVAAAIDPDDIDEDSFAPMLTRLIEFARDLEKRATKALDALPNAKL